MESAADSRSSDLLLQFLTLTGWRVEIRDDGRGVTALAVRDHEHGPLRITAWARTRQALAIVLFEQVCARLGVGRTWDS